MADLTAQPSEATTATADVSNANSVETTTGQIEKENPVISSDFIQREPSTRVKKNHPSDLILGNLEETTMKTRGCGSSSKSVKSQQETVPESVPTTTPPVPASIPAVSPPTGRRPKTTARKKVLALSGPIGSTILGASSKGVTFPNLDAQPIQASAVPLASFEGQIKAKLALATSHSQSISTKVVSDPSDHDSESSLSPDVLTPKGKGKRKTKAARTKKDSQPEFDPSLTEPNPNVPLDDLAEETESEDDPSEASPIASDPKSTTLLAFPVLTSKLPKQKDAPKSHETLTSPLVGPTYTVNDDPTPSTTRKVKGINLAGSGSGTVVTDTPAILTDLTSVQTGITRLFDQFTLMEDTQCQILSSLAIISASTSPTP
ncbi:uncharacterized protein LOC133779217 [Humulus lupulus]|uniref:uncharacterized protein LOC133779217 n=1 Tax=Humulus lupulus TaxID=3486 RepID=UPI002B415FC7|nr:uncharacterized protein LOC133779217 [Humulus lupulus]